MATVDNSNNEDDTEYIFRVSKYKRSRGQGYRRKLAFTKSHSGHCFSLLAKLTKWVVLKVYFPEEGRHNIRGLQINASQHVNEETKKNARKLCKHGGSDVLSPKRVNTFEEERKSLDNVLP